MTEKEKQLRKEIRRLKKLLDKYSEYYSLTLDGVTPEEASRIVKL